MVMIDEYLMLIATYFQIMNDCGDDKLLHPMINYGN